MAAVKLSVMGQVALGSLPGRERRDLLFIIVNSFTPRMAFHAIRGFQGDSLERLALSSQQAGLVKRPFGASCVAGQLLVQGSSLSHRSSGRCRLVERSRTDLPALPRPLRAAASDLKFCSAGFKRGYDTPPRLPWRPERDFVARMLVSARLARRSARRPRHRDLCDARASACVRRQCATPKAKITSNPRLLVAHGTVAPVTLHTAPIMPRL